MNFDSVLQKMFSVLKRIFKFFLLLATCLFVVFIFWYFAVEPTYLHDYNPLYQKLPEVSFDRDVVTVHNVRNFLHADKESYIQDYYDATFDLDTIRSVDYILIPFTDSKLKTHAMLSFGFDDGTYITVSPEGMREKGEEYSIFKTIFRQLELSYLVVDEKDALTLRAFSRGNTVYLYPLLLPKENMKILAKNMLVRAEELSRKPTWYSLFRDACTISVIKHIQKSLQKEDTLFGFTIPTPIFSDKYLYDNYLIDTSISFHEVKRKAIVDEKIRQNIENNFDFSKKIRGI